MLKLRFSKLILVLVAGAALAVGGCSDTLKQQIRQYDYKRMNQAEKDLARTPSPISNVLDMPGWTTDLEGALAFARVNERPTVVFLYRGGQGASEKAKRDINNTSASDRKERVAIDIGPNPAVAERFSASQTPALLVLDPAGNPVARASGTISQAQITKALQ